MKKAKDNFFVREFKAIGKSFKVDKTFFQIYSIELIFYLIVAGVFFLWLKFGLAQGTVLKQISELNYQVNAGDLAKAELLVPLIKQFVIYLAVFSLMLFFTLLLGWVASRMLVWNKFLRKEISKKFYFKFLLLKVIWKLFWLPLILILIVPFIMYMSVIKTDPSQANILILILLANIVLYLVISYFGMFLYNSFFEHRKIYKSITESFSAGFSNLPLMIFPLILISIISLFWYIVMLIIGKSIPHSIFVNVFIFIYIFTALRIYIMNKVIKV